jgi:hypothetical protein
VLVDTNIQDAIDAARLADRELESARTAREAAWKASHAADAAYCAASEANALAQEALLRATGVSVTWIRR